MRKAKTKKKTRIAWSKDEVKLLKRLYPDNTARDIANELGRTVTAVRTKARKLGFAGKVRVWSKKELNLLKRLYPSKTARETAEQIGRSLRATRSKIHILGLRKESKYEQCHRVVKGTREKLCGECRKWKAESQFCKNRRLKDGLQWRCKECESKYTRKRYKRIKKRRLSAKS